jgi:hypothetical protein
VRPELIRAQIEILQLFGFDFHAGIVTLDDVCVKTDIDS